MAYSPYQSIPFVYSGLALTAGAPADLITFRVPVSGQRYVLQNPILYQIAGTGNLGNIRLPLTGFSLPAGAGVSVLGATVTAGALNPGAAALTNHTITGFVATTGFTLRQTANCPISGLYGLSFQLLQLL